jgi:ABC-2 type transport system permease protein
MPGRRDGFHVSGNHHSVAGRPCPCAVRPLLILTVIGELLLLSFTLTAFGVMMAARITQIQAFMALTQMLVMPLFFLSGALYPFRARPAWLVGRGHPVRPDPLRGIPVRHAVFSHRNLSPAADAALSPPPT